MDKRIDVSVVSSLASPKIKSEQRTASGTTALLNAANIP